MKVVLALKWLLNAILSVFTGSGFWKYTDQPLTLKNRRTGALYLVLFYFLLAATVSLW